MILNAVKKAFKLKEERGWDKVFFFFDIHETVLYPDYNNMAKVYYPYAKDVLTWFSQMEGVTLCLYTCSYPHEIEEYLKFFKEDGIDFTYVNKNPEAGNTKHGYFEDKPYMNALWDDKAGFDPETEWWTMLNYLIELEKTRLDKFWKEELNK